MAKLKSNYLISMDDLSTEEVLYLLDKAKHIKSKPKKYRKKALNKILALLFFESSTRTYFSFISSMQRLGGNTLGFADIRNTSVEKGESLEDTAKIMSSYADIMVVRHSQLGSMNRIKNVIDIPLISGGEGIGEHPTQTLTD